MSFGPAEHNGGGLVEYRVLKPGVYTPPMTHNRLAADRYAAPSDPRLELLDELDVIEVTDWGEGP